MRPERFAAYHGPTWRGRRGSLAEEIRRGDGWAPLACDSEWSPLTDVLLYLPGPRVAGLSDPDAVLHVGSIDHDLLVREHQALVRAYERAGVRVHRLAHVDDVRHPNAMFARDLFWQTAQGAVVSRMASPVRAGEERYVTRALAERGVPIAMTVSGEGTLEAADCLWLDPRRVLCGVGARTNEHGFEQLRQLLALQDVTCLRVSTPPAVQHLLGCVQIVSAARALVRVELADDEVSAVLQDAGIEVVPIAETAEVVDRLAFNFVTIGQDRVVLTDGCPQFRRRLESVGVQVAAEVPASQYVRAAGGLGCATGILARRPVAD